MIKFDKTLQGYMSQEFPDAIESFCQHEGYIVYYDGDMFETLNTIFTDISLANMLELDLF
jgi:hypothetical protein